MREFAVWATLPQRVRLDVDGTLYNMARGEDGWWRTTVEARPDARYGFVLNDDSQVLPDPRSPRQPDGVHERSQLWALDPAAWTDAGWMGRPIGGVIYELHTGTFTPEGTLDSAIRRLDYLVELGVDLVQLMPVNAFSGTHGWGYDGVLWYAVHEPYGGPDALVRFVNAAHERGLGVLIDAVFNHLGPSGNYLQLFGPYLSSDAGNPWGESLNLSGPDADEVRRYIIDCALRWMRDFHADGLRLDAVHALMDTTALHILEELATETDALAEQLGRPLSLIAESDLNDPRLITPRDRGGYGLAAQWDDDIHHAIHTAVSGERQGYYADFGSLETLAITLQSGYFHAGTYSSFRGRRHGRPLDKSLIPATRLMAYTTTHDQVGNRAVGDRPSQYLDSGQLAVKAALVLGSPYTAMVFMGEEWGSSRPFQFFTSHPEPELAQATAEGRKAEFADHGWDADEIPDPQDTQTFLRSKLNWDEVHDGEHARLLEVYTSLIALRHNEPDLADPWLGHLSVDYDEGRRWIAMRRGSLVIACNIGQDAVEVPYTGEVVLAWDEPDVTDEATRLPGHSFAILRAAPTG